MLHLPTKKKKMETFIALALGLLFTTNNPNSTLPEKEEIIIYNESAKRTNDLIHTDLEVSFNWEKQHVNGRAKITVKPYFHSTSQLVLDAKGFDIHSVT